MKLLFSLLLAAFSINCYANYILVNKGGDNGAFITSANPGDTFAFRSSLNPWSYVYVNASGNAAKKIVFINVGGQVQMTSGFQFENSNYFKLTGTGSSNTYGFLVKDNAGSGVALNVSGKSAFFSIDHIQVAQKLYAVWVKNEVSCDVTLNYPNRPIHDFELSYIDVNTVNQDGFYLGSTAPTGGRSITCNGTTYNNRIAGRMYNVYVHHITMTRTGRTGIQLSGCDSGTNRIAYCTIKNCGFEFNSSQGAGIWLGGMTASCEVDNNNVDSTWLHNYISYGIKTCYFHNNIGSHAGMLSGDSAGIKGNHRNNGYSSALINDPPSVPVTKSTFVWEHNTLGANTDPSGVKVAVLKWTDNYTTTGNVICDCGSPIFVTSGITYSTACTTSACTIVYDIEPNNGTGTAVQIPLNTQVKGTIGNSGDRDYYKFNVINADSVTITLTTLPLNYNLYLSDSSGTSLKVAKKDGTANETIKFYSAAGKKYYVSVISSADTIFDAANCYTLNVATQSAQKQISPKEQLISTGIKVYPNPARSVVNVYIETVPNNSTVRLLDSYGKIIAVKTAVKGNIQFDINKFSAGNYFISITSKEGNRIYNNMFIKE